MDDFKKRLRTYRSRANRYSKLCEEKAVHASINVRVSSKEARETLHELIDFAKTI